MTTSATPIDEKKTWTYAFLILLVVSLAMLTLRVTGREFLVLEFEVSLIYFPTVLAGVVAAYLGIRGAK